jgi:hypothetical protein
MPNLRMTQTSSSHILMPSLLFCKHLFSINWGPDPGQRKEMGKEGLIPVLGCSSVWRGKVIHIQ